MNIKSSVLQDCQALQGINIVMVIVNSLLKEIMVNSLLKETKYFISSNNFHVT